MKTCLLLALMHIAPCTLVAQTLIDTNAFFDPDFKVRRYGATSGAFNLAVINAMVNGSGSSGNNSWTHSAGGHAQVRTSLPLVATLDAQLAAYTRTVGDSLVFGREITTSAEFLGAPVDVSSDLEALANQVAGASVTYNWQSNATISGLAIIPNQLYQVDFIVTSGAGLPANLLNSSTFGITTAGVTGASNESAVSLNLLNTFTTGPSSSTGNFSFIFKSNQSLSALDFSFAASTLSGVSLLGGTADDQNVLTFSGFQVTTVPEPGSLALCSGFVAMMMLRRRR